MTTNKQKPGSVKSVLDDSAESLDATTLSKLRQARYKALEQASGHRVSAASWWVPAGAVTATTVIAVFAFWLGVVNPQTRVNTIEDLDLLASADNTELYEQIEFYEWLQSQDQKRRIDAG